MKTKRTISLMLIMLMLLAAVPFGDLALASRTPSNWAVPEIIDANTSGLLTPSAANDFLRPLTRDEFCELVVEMVERTLGDSLPMPSYNPFVDDVDPISIHALKAWNYGIILGITNTKFAPKDNVERQQLCTMMIRAIHGLEKDLKTNLLLPGIATLPYKDASNILEYAVDSVKLAYTNGIMHGNTLGQFLPRDNISSEECVAVIIRSFSRMEAVRVGGMSTSELLDTAVKRVRIGYAYGDTSSGVTQNVMLPTKSTGNSTVTWTSSDNSIINIVGDVGYVHVGTSARTVKLTAKISIGNSSRTLEFTLTTSPYTGDRLLLENAVNELNIIYLNDGDSAESVTGRIGLPTTVLGLPVSWSSNNASVVSAAGIVNVPSGNEQRSVTLSAVITYDSQTRTKTFNLTVVNPNFSRGVMLHGVYFGMTQTQVTQLLGTVRRTIAASSTESWQLYYNTRLANFIAVAFIGGRAVAVYSMATDAANQLKNRDGATITIAQANAYGGVNATAYIDPGNSSRQYAIMIYDNATVIGTSRTLLADGQEQLMFELVNAFRVSNNRSILDWSDKLGSPARTHSSNRGSGNLRDRVVNGGYDSARYTAGDTVGGDNDAFDALDQIIGNSTGTSSMRSQILNNSATLFGAGFSGGNSGSIKTYYTYALGSAITITDVTARKDNANVTTVNVTPGAAAAVSISLIMSPTTFNENFAVTSSNTSRMTVTNVTKTTTGATITVTGVTSGTANIVVTGNCSGKTHTIPVSVGTTVFANNLTLTCSPTGSSKTLSSSTGVTGNATRDGSFVLVIGNGTNDSLTINASTTSGATVTWARTAGTAATVTKATNSNNATIAASSATATGEITLTAKVQTGSNTYITHTIKVRVVSVSQGITLNPTTVNVDSNMTATVTVGALPTGIGATPAYAWTSSGNQLTRVSSTDGTATFKGANPGSSTITVTATWAGDATGSASQVPFLGRVTRSVGTTVNAQQFATEINLSHSTLSMIPGETFTVTASTVPASITQSYSFTWDFDEYGCVVVKPSGLHSANGLITAPKTGTAVITVKLVQENGPAFQKTITVTVDWPSISIIAPSRIVEGEPATFTWAEISDYSIKWSCTDLTGEATIDSDSGVMTPITAGTVRVTASLYYKDADTGSEASRTVTIEDGI